MKITQLDIEGFRSLKKVSWKPGDLNIVIGPNGSGKSNLLRALELISAGAQGNLSDYIIGQGGFDALTWDGQARRILIRFENSTEGDPFIEADLYYQAELVKVFNDYLVDNEALGTIGSKKLRLTRQRNTAQLLDSSLGQPQYRDFKPNQINTEEFILSSTAALWNEDYETNLLREETALWRVYHDLRVDQDAIIRQPVISRVEKKVNATGQNLVNVLHTLYSGDRNFKQQINSAMQAAFGNDFDELIFPPASDQRIQLRVRWKTLKREQSAANLSDGTLKFLLLVTVLASPNPAPLIAIDEPETGLHPSMLPIIAEFAVDAAERTQVIFTTHSDQFLDAFRDTRPTTTVAKWENGETTLTTLSDEDLAYWLKDYSLGRLYRSGELEALA